MYKKLLLGTLVLLLAACSGTSQPAAEFTVTMSDFVFTPSVLTVKAGEPVVVTIVNEGPSEHDFVVERIDVSSVVAEGSGMGDHHMSGSHSDYDLHISTEAGGTSVLKFTANEPGTYKIFCSVEGHETAGMVGELVVVSE